MKKQLLAALLSIAAVPLFGQMLIGTDTLYGNEWIDFNKTYFKIKVAEDGIYRLPQPLLATAGLGNVPGSQFQLWRDGREVPIFSSADGPLGAADFIEFWGEKGRAALDEHLFFKKDQLLNPEHGTYTDTAAYFLTFTTTGQPLRFKAVANDPTGQPEPFVIARSTVVFNQEYAKARLLSNSHKNSYFDREGWGSLFLSNDPLTEVAVPTPFASSTGPAAVVSTRYLTDIYDHTILISVDGKPAATDAAAGSEVRPFSFSIPANEVEAATDLRFEGDNQYGRVSVGAASVEYAHTMDFEGKKVFDFKIDGSAGGQKLLDIANFDASGGEAVMLDFAQNRRITGEKSGSSIKIGLTTAAGPNGRAILFNTSSGVKTVAALAPVVFKNWKNTNADFVIVASKRLFDDGSGSNWPQAHADYRASAAGGGHTVLLVEQGEVYDQFGWGQPLHPQGLRNFFFFMKKNWPAARHVLLMGKPRELTDSRTPAQIAANSATFLMPTFGSPGGDNLFVMKNGSMVPYLSIGRLAAKTGADVKTYLDKLVEHEAPDADPQTIGGQFWKKNVIHLSGGDPSILNELRNYMGSFEDILESSKMGAEVTTYSKTSTDPIQTSPAAGMLDNFKKGCAIFSVFGHSNPSSFDSYIEPPKNWGNKGRYPVMWGFGCYSGQCGTSGAALGEQVTLSPSAGGIGFYATTGYGYLSDLPVVGRAQFDTLGNTSFGEPVGLVWQKTCAALAKPFGELGINQLLQQWQYQGDPAVRVSPFPGADYTIDPASLKISPEPVAIDRDSFSIKFDLLNIGRNLPDTVVVQIDLKSPTGLAALPVFIKILPKKYRTTASATVALPSGDPSPWLGFNRLELTVDPANLLAELPSPAAEMNNHLIGPDGLPGVPVYFFGNDVQPISPADFSIFSKKQPVLTAVTLNPFEAAQRFFWEMDTTATFDSPLLQKTMAVQPGGILQWAPPAVLLDSTIYYWRISRDTAGIGQFVWHPMSFIHIKDGPEGWNQSHYHQFLLDEGQNGLYLDSTRHWSFKDFIFELRLFLGPLEAFGPIVFYKQQGQFGGGGPGSLASFTMMTAEFDGVSGELLQSNPLDPSTRAKRWLTTTLSGRKELMDHLKGAKKGNYHLLLGQADKAGDSYRPQDWAIDSLQFGENLLQILEAEGATLIRQLAKDSTGWPYAFLFKKGGGFQPVEFAHPADTLKDYNTGLWLKLESGALSTPPIGPAKNWGQLEWLAAPADTSLDMSLLNIYGVRPGAADTLLVSNIADWNRPLTDIPAKTWPKIRLEWQTRDLGKHTPAPLSKLRVLYEAMPEGAIDPQAHRLFEKDTVAQGEPLRVAATFRHIDGGAMDSVLVRFAVRDPQNQQFVFEKRQKALPVGDSIFIKEAVETRQLVGNQQFTLDVNPSADQPEREHFNNILVKNFTVTGDRLNPLLDVTFDGDHLLDGDLVSPKPEILIALRDENRWLAMDDTASLTITVKWPDSTERTFHLDGSDAQAVFTPASSGNLGKKNEATARLNPYFDQDGVYQLRVKGRDISGNQSGAVDFLVNFEVINKSSVSGLLNYPNPFSTRTCFAYTLTGELPPSHFRLQIMTVSGKIVREITEGEFGPLRPGRHVSDFCWDGRDEFGDQLANGVYLYRVLAKKADGADFEHFENKKVDGFFTQGWGKMVLIR